MKRISLCQWATMMLVAMASVTLVACGSDDDDDGGMSVNGGKGLVTPQYESVSALYEITDVDSDIRSIELTASGNYIIVENTSYYAPKRKGAPVRKARFIPLARLTRASGYGNGVIEGTYTKLSDTEFLLDGWGKITVTGSSDNAQSITVTPTNGTPYTVTAAKHTQYPSSDLTNKLCRTWSISTFRCVVMVDKKKAFEKEYKAADFYKWVEDMASWSAQYEFDDDVDDAYDDDYDYVYDEDEWGGIPEQIVFTKSGTYMVYYSAEQLAISTWAWVNEEKGQLRYSWNYGDMYDDDMAGIISVAFRDNQLAITEIIDNEDDDYDEDEISAYIYITWYMD